MKSTLFAAMFALMAAPQAQAQDQITSGVWQYPLPTKPAPAPTCHVFGDNLLCNGPVVMPTLPEPKAPANCSFNKSGKFVCR